MIKQAKFVVSVADASKVPDYGVPEIAIAGKSNVGKSSFINFMVNQNKLAKTSQEPGRTRLLNYFEINNGEYYFVDLPGYGYAKVSKDAQNRWQKYLEEYLLKRTQIKTLIQLIDARHDIQKNDFQMREWVEAYKLPIITVVTKMDYVPKTKTLNIIKNVEKQFGGLVLPFSAVDNRYNERIFQILLDE